MTIPSTHLSRESLAYLLAESRRMGEQRQQIRAARDAFDAHLSDDQRHQRALFEARMRANRLRPLPSVFGALA